MPEVPVQQRGIRVKEKVFILNEQTLLHNVGIRSIKNGKEVIYTLISAGCSWYDAAVTQKCCCGEKIIF